MALATETTLSPAKDSTPKLITSPIRLSSTVLLYNSPRKLWVDDRTTPKLVILASWMDARDVHITKYIARYQQMYPMASILVIKSSFKHYLSPKTCRRDTAPAAEVIRNTVPPSSDSTPRMIIHLFSNGGSCILYTLYGLYRELVTRTMASDGDSNVLIPPHVTIYDSVPGGWSYSGSTTAILSSLPSRWIRLLIFPFVHLLGLWWIIKYRVFKVREETALWASAHNDVDLVHEACRSYIYSEADGMVDYRIVEKHADDAKVKGFTVLRREGYKDSEHVAHARKYPEQYWEVVRESWELGSRGRATVSVDRVEDPST
ncbi:MAG: hypothetical protein M1820_004355 [Bogoriella megaspora]|nr:MAG: hypothetical protein M1820_004355 [Bogoriella megaspora]